LSGGPHIVSAIRSLLKHISLRKITELRRIKFAFTDCPLSVGAERKHLLTTLGTRRPRRQDQRRRRQRASLSPGPPRRAMGTTSARQAL